MTLATSAGGSEEGMLVNRVVVQEPVELSSDDALDRDVINRRRSTLQYLSKTLPRRYSSPALLIDNTDRPSSTPLPLNLPRFIVLQNHNVGSPSGYNAFNCVFVTKTNDKNNLSSGDYSKKLTVRF